MVNLWRFFAFFHILPVKHPIFILDYIIKSQKIPKTESNIYHPLAQRRDRKKNHAKESVTCLGTLGPNYFFFGKTHV